MRTGLRRNGSTRARVAAGGGGGRAPVRVCGPPGSGCWRPGADAGGARGRARARPCGAACRAYAGCACVRRAAAAGGPWCGRAGRRAAAAGGPAPVLAVRGARARGRTGPRAGFAPGSPSWSVRLGVLVPGCAAVGRVCSRRAHAPACPCPVSACPCPVCSRLRACASCVWACMSRARTVRVRAGTSCATGCEQAHDAGVARCKARMVSLRSCPRPRCARATCPREKQVSLRQVATCCGQRTCDIRNYAARSLPTGPSLRHGPPSLAFDAAHRDRTPARRPLVLHLRAFAPYSCHCSQHLAVNL